MTLYPIFSKENHGPAVTSLDDLEGPMIGLVEFDKSDTALDMARKCDAAGFPEVGDWFRSQA